MLSLTCTQDAFLSQGGTPKQQEVPRVMKTRCPTFRGTLREPGEESVETEEEAEVIQLRPVPSRQHLRWSQGARGVPGFHPGCVSLPWDAAKSVKMSRWSPGDGARMPSFQGDIEAAWRKKERGRGRDWGPPLEATAFLGASAPGLGDLCGPWLAPRGCVSLMGDTPKWQEEPKVMDGDRHQAFRKTLTQPMKTSCKAEEEAEVVL